MISDLFDISKDQEILIAQKKNEKRHDMNGKTKSARNFIYTLTR